MKRTVLTAALSLAFAGSLVFAQAPQTQQDQQPPAPVTRPQHQGYGDHHARPHDPHREAMMLSHRLNLSPDQTARIEPILADREQKMAAIHANTSLSPQDMHQQMRALQEQEKSQFAAVLTPEQQEQMKQMHHGHHGQFHGQPGAQPSTGL